MRDETGLRLSGPQRQKLYNALLSAFPTRGELARMINFRLEQNLEVIAGGDTYAYVIFNLITWAVARGQVKELVVKARRENPGNPELRAFEEQVLRSPRVKPPKTKGVDRVVGPPTREALREEGERLIVPSPGTLNGPERYSFVDVSLVGNWCLRLGQVAQTICIIQLHSHVATGFLIGPNLVLTCYHVMADMVEPGYYEDPITGNRVALSPNHANLRFGYVLADGTLEGQIYRLTNDWLIDSSPVDKLNYALLRIDGSPVADWAENWIDSTSEGEFPREAPLFVLQHPAGKPLQISYATEEAWNDQRTRVTYITNTAPGSSGAPCFSARWDLVAMYEKNLSAEMNYPLARQGIPISLIMAQPKVQTALDQNYHPRGQKCRAKRKP
jgi:endonuclease G, mitochondrial